MSPKRLVMTCKSNPCGNAQSELGVLGIIDEVKPEIIKGWHYKMSALKEKLTVSRQSTFINLNNLIP